MKRAGLIFVAALMAACSPPQQQQTGATQITVPISSGCNAQTSRDWSAVGSQYYLIEAEAEGATCPDAVATMRIKSRDGAALFTREYPVREVPLAFNPNGDQTSLRSDLEGWTQNTADPPTADTLPPWPAGARRPPGFEPAVSRNRYEDARAQGPLFCFPDGGESNACVALAGDAATYLGSLTPERP
jgi:hypothetical protein